MKRSEIFLNRISSGAFNQPQIIPHGRNYSDDLAAYRFDSYISSCGYVLQKSRLVRDAYCG